MSPYEAEPSLHAECATLQSLDHEGIVKAHGLWRCPVSHKLHLILEHFDGKPLQEIIKVCQEKRSGGGARVWDQASADIVQQLGAALTHAHARKVLHNDIKPDNVLVRLRQGELRVKLVDFDAAGDNSVRGAFAYAAPERITNHKPSERSDVYSLAVLVFKLLAGTEPYRQKDRTESLAAREIPIDRPTTSDEVGREAKAWLERSAPGVLPALCQALTVDPKLRPRSVQAFLNSLPQPGLPGQLGAGATPAETWEPNVAYALGAAAAMVLLALNVLPLGDSALSQGLLGRGPTHACLANLTPLALNVCRRLTAPGPDCVETLTFLAAEQECTTRTNLLINCVPDW